MSFPRRWFFVANYFLLESSIFHLMFCQLKGGLFKGNARKFSRRAYIETRWQPFIAVQNSLFLMTKLLRPSSFP
jgi:hypothetical protein